MAAHCVWGNPLIFLADKYRFEPKIFLANDFLVIKSFIH